MVWVDDSKKKHNCRKGKYERGRAARTKWVADHPVYREAAILDSEFSAIARDA